MILPFDEKNVFRGYDAYDIQRVSALKALVQDPHPEHFIDMFGVHVHPSYCPWAPAGYVSTNDPFPSDGYLAEGMEYAAMALALEWAKGGSFVVAEMGAGWGPWVSLGALLARRKGIPTIHMIACEADAARFQMLRKHLAVNGLVAETDDPIGERGDLFWRLYQCAAHFEDTTLYWPETDDPNDAGLSAAKDEGAGVDDRGNTRTFRPVPALSVSTMLVDLPMIDLIHFDLQGGEHETVPQSLPFLNERVKSMFIGTHSRKIEGDLVHLLRDQEWTLIREKPCQFYTSARAPQLTGQTYVDGGQFWRNNRFA